jgi:hypothetical protein
MEKENGMDVSALFDRNTTNINHTQTNFISYVVAPLAAEVVRLFPTSLSVLGDNLVANHQMWFDKCVADSQSSTGVGENADAGKVDTHVLHGMKERVQRVKHLMREAPMVNE